MAQLVIRNESTGAGWRLWPDAEPIPPGAIAETVSYIFELNGSAESGDAELLVDDLRLEALRAPAAGAARWRWTPGFHAGAAEAELRLSGHPPRRLEVITDPDRRKLTRDDFDAMVREILDDTYALFSLSGFRKGIAKGAGGRPPAIARLEFLRSRIAEIESVVASIARNPRRLLVAEDVTLPYHRARHARGPDVLKSLRSGRVLREAGHPGRLPPGLQGNLPERIHMRQRRSSLDIAEHRQMAACLRAWSTWLGVAADQLARVADPGDAELKQGAVHWAGRCRRLARRLATIAAGPPFEAVGEAPARLMFSALFRNDPTYRRFYRLWQDMNLGIAAVFGDFLNLPLARTFELYELWAFLRLVRAGAEAFGPEGLEVGDLFLRDAAGSVTIAAGAVTVPVGDGWRVCFQKSYREFWIEPDGQGSNSRVMTPDVVVARSGTSVDDPGRLIVLDAKYRIDTGLNDALSSIHTYRDALVKDSGNGEVSGIVTAAYLVAPFIPTLKDDWRETQLPGRLFHPAYRTGFRFGAVTLRPGMRPGEITAALRTIVADATGDL
jgi:Domain of unknown function (DUF2357)/PD-(D/E)XK nuclease superfamily